MSRRRAGQTAFVCQNNKRNNSITLPNKLSLYVYLENRWKRLHMFGKSSFHDLEPSTVIHADSVSFLTFADDRIQKFSSMFGFPLTNPSVDS